jgi:hypothetical protein
VATQPVQQDPYPDDGVIPIEWAGEDQRWLFACGPQPTLLMGGLNAAKTTGAVLKVLKFAFDYPRSHVGIVRKTYAQLKKTTMQTFYALLDPLHYDKGSRNDQDGYLRLNNGTEIFFIHLDTPDSMTLLAGLELNAVFVDQAEEISETAWDTLGIRIGRWRFAEVSQDMLETYERRNGKPWPWKTKDGKPIPPPYQFATANPPDDELHWLFKRFSEDSTEWKDKYKALGYQYRRTDSRNNKFALQHNIDSLLAHDDDYVDQFVAGKWMRPKGQIFRIDPMSILEPDEQLIAMIRNTMPLGRALDHGDTAPTCCLWFGVDGDSNIFFFMEYYQGGFTTEGAEVGISDHRKAITQMSEGLYIRSNIADPSIFYKARNISAYVTRSQRHSVADEYSDRELFDPATVLYWSPADNGEAIGRSRIREYLRVDPTHRHPITGELGAPHVYFIRATPEYPHGCDRAITELRAQKRIKIGESNGRAVYSDERDPTVVDHAFDAARYALVSFPMAAQPDAPAVKPRVEMQGQRVIITVPPITSLPLPKEQREGRWRSRAGGY